MYAVPGLVTSRKNEESAKTFDVDTHDSSIYANSDVYNVSAGEDYEVDSQYDCTIIVVCNNGYGQMK